MQIITDYLSVTMPVGAGPDLRDALTDVCLSLPESQTDPLGVRVGKFGLLRFQDRHGVTIASASGVMLATLRAASLLEQYCVGIASVGPHRVTQIHAAGDVECDAPAELKRLYGLLRVGGIQLTRKRIPPSQVKTIFSPGEDLRDTGSIMCGHRARHETTLCIYDRRHDAIEKGKPDPGPVLRYELRTSVPGLTLRDAVQPEPVFYHFMGALFPRPDAVPTWEPHGEGFVMQRQPIELQDRLRRLVDQSPDFARAIELADQLPGEGFDVLVRMLQSRAKRVRATRAFAAVGGVPCDSEAAGRPSDDAASAAAAPDG